MRDAFWGVVIAAAEAALPDFLLLQRWYPAKDAGRPTVQMADFIPFRATQLEAVIAVWQVSPPNAHPLLMFVPLAVRTADGLNPPQKIASLQSNSGDSPFAIVEAFSDDRFVRAWLEFQLQSSAFSESGRSLYAGRTQHPAAIDVPTAEIHRPKVEQSNTSLRIGGAILKVLRKLETGAHPELEISRFLDQAGFAATPPLLAWTELARQLDGERYALSLLQEFVPNQGDGWSWVLDQLARGAAFGGPNSSDELGGWLRVLAQRTGEMHRVFSQDTADPAFQPEVVASDDIASWVSAALAMAERALQGLAAHPGHDPKDTLLARALTNSRDLLQAQVRSVANLQSRFFKTRHHGDLHLGQVLVAGKDAVILDFEGEPLRSLAERRAKNCVLRDVAGVLRSISYAAETTARRLPEDMVQDERYKRIRALEQWRQDASRSFVGSYFAAAGDLRSIPAARPEADHLLKFFELEKALYEMIYELANRPDWISIPLRGVISLMREAGTHIG
jgi:trehalose synthase-fused probable maltokinase